jgi:hypothetical protein
VLESLEKVTSLTWGLFKRGQGRRYGRQYGRESQAEFKLHLSALLCVCLCTLSLFMSIMSVLTVRMPSPASHVQAVQTEELSSAAQVAHFDADTV